MPARPAPARLPPDLRRALRLARGLPALIVWAAGCEALVPGHLDDVRCLDEGKVGPPTCPIGLQCNAGVCSPSELGAPCATDADCRGGDVCLEPAAFGAPGRKLCSRTCCTSSDCDPQTDFVCWIPPAGGGSFCRPAADVARAPGGPLLAWETCVADTQCRSGRCLDHRCADTCCSDTSCVAGGGACRFGHPAPDDAAGFWCATPPTGTSPRYAPCKMNADCASGLCLALGTLGLRCSAPCCGSSDCEDANGVPVRCVTLPGTDGRVRACGAIAAGMGMAAVGVPCAADGDCRSGTCLDQGGHKRCSDACCSDASCDDPSVLACRPTHLDDGWALRCGPK